MATFKITTLTTTLEYTKHYASEARNTAIELISECFSANINVDKSCRFEVKGKPVSAIEFKKACEIVLDEKLAKKKETHTLIWVSKGATKLPNTWHQVWVKQ